MAKADAGFVVDPSAGVVMVCRDGDIEQTVADYFAANADNSTGVPMVTVSSPVCGQSRRYSVKEFPRADAPCAGGGMFVRWKFV